MYVPHGAVPDRRGFAPAIVAWELARRLKTASPCVISAREGHAAASETVQGIPVHRIKLAACVTLLGRVRAQGVAHFDWSVITKQTETLYHRVVGKAG